MTKPLPPNKTKPLLESFKRKSAELEVYEIQSLRPQDLKELLTESHSWIVVGKSKWT